jgi:hypothetical protein
MRRRSLPLVLAPLLLLAGRAEARGTVWVVDPGGGGDFTTIQAAVDAASSGDQILVRAGSYPPFTIDGKALAVRAEVVHGPRVDQGAVVRNVPAGLQVELAGLRLNHLRGPLASGLVCESSAGVVRAVDCLIGGHDGGGTSIETWSSLPAVRADSCAELVLVRCALQGGHGATNEDEDQQPPASDGSAALLASACGLSIHDSTLAGGHGGGEFDTTCHTGGDGGDGLTLLGAGSLLAAGSSFTGGAGGDGGDGEFLGCECADGGPGGDGVATSAPVTWSASSATGGAGGPPGGPTCSSGFPGQPVAGTTPTVADRAPFCFGTSTACPCANLGRSLAGCENSFSTGGALLTIAGTASVSADTVRLDATGLPTTTPPALFFQGTLRQAVGVGSLFADGLLCAGGTILRLKGRTASGGAVSIGFGIPGDPAISVRGMVPPAGGTRTYQVWHRNNQVFCTPERFNLSNGVELVWAP